MPEAWWPPVTLQACLLRPLQLHKAVVGCAARILQLVSSVPPLTHARAAPGPNANAQRLRAADLSCARRGLLGSKSGAATQQHTLCGMLRQRHLVAPAGFAAAAVRKRSGYTHDEGGCLRSRVHGLLMHPRIA